MLESDKRYQQNKGKGLNFKPGWTIPAPGEHIHTADSYEDPMTGTLELDAVKMYQAIQNRTRTNELMGF